MQGAGFRVQGSYLLVEVSKVLGLLLGEGVPLVHIHHRASKHDPQQRRFRNPHSRPSGTTPAGGSLKPLSVLAFLNTNKGFQLNTNKGFLNTNKKNQQPKLVIFSGMPAFHTFLLKEAKYSAFFSAKASPLYTFTTGLHIYKYRYIDI